MAAPNGLARIETHGKTKQHVNGVCHDDSAAPVRAQTIDELHSLQRKWSAPTTPIKDGAASPFAAALSEEERHRQQLQSIRCSRPPPPPIPLFFLDRFVFVLLLHVDCSND
jgi:phosphoenolpyruvate carboxykinase (ATP)